MVGEITGTEGGFGGWGEMEQSGAGKTLGRSCGNNWDRRSFGNQMGQTGINWDGVEEAIGTGALGKQLAQTGQDTDWESRDAART